MTEIYPLQVLLLALAGFVNRRQHAVIEYLIEEKRVLKEQLGGRRLRLTDAQRRRLAAKAKRLGRHLLGQVATVVTPDTLLRWHRRLIALKWTYSSGRVGRPGIMKKIPSAHRANGDRELALGLLSDPRFASESRTSGRAEHHRQGVAGTRHQAGARSSDRDGKFPSRCKEVLSSSGVNIVLTPYRAPNANAHLERFIRSIKEECLDRMIIFGEAQLRRAITEYLAHYHRERNHQGIANELIDAELSSDEGDVVCRERLGGMLRYYHRAA